MFGVCMIAETEGLVVAWQATNEEGGNIFIFASLSFVGNYTEWFFCLRLSAGNHAG